MLSPSAPQAEAPGRAIGRGRIVAVVIAGVVALALAAGPTLSDLSATLRSSRATIPVLQASSPDEVTVALSAPATLDPAAAGDAASAAVIAQVFESLTTVDADLVVRPALAESWTFSDDGRTVVFTLRDGLRFSDGMPLTAADVKRSWMRLLDPQAPSPLSSLLDDVVGASDFAHGRAASDTVGIEADGNTLTVRMTRPATDFASVVASPSLAVVPSGLRTVPAPLVPGPGFVASGGYVPTSATTSTIELTANERYWAGAPAIRNVHVLTTLDGASPVQEFQDGNVDLTSIGSDDASWIAYDRDLGPALRQGTSLSLEYFGFDTRKPPFDDVRVRRAFASAIDWRHLVALGSDGSEEAATSMVPPAVPGRATQDFVPAFDPAAARALLTEAGYPGGVGFPSITLMTTGNPYAAGVAAQLKENLGVTIATESMDFTQYFERLQSDDPFAFWAVDWIADYPARTATLRLLLGSDQSNNYGRWSSAAYDAALAEATSATDPATAAAAFDRAEAIVRDEAPVVPLSYSTSWWLSRDGLLGAGENGLGFIRLAGLDWADR
jgi:oligopeptide transport system substrate-binding protein